MNNITRFVEHYKKFENWALANFEIETIADLEQFGYGLNRYRSKLKLYRKLRNLISHNPVLGESGEKNALSISSRLLSEFDNMVREFESPIISIAIDTMTVYKRRMDDNIMATMRTMDVMDYTHVPIMQGSKVCGVFSEKTVFKMRCNGDMVYDDDVFEDIANYIGLESFESSCYDFVPADMPVSKALERFAVAKNRNKRLDLLLITDDGTFNGNLKGIVSAWDMAAV